MIINGNGYQLINEDAYQLSMKMVIYGNGYQ